MGRGSSKAGGSGQIATNAVAIENMNEAQLKKEIKKQENVIARADKIINDKTQPKENIGLIPITQTQRGMTQSQRDKAIERSLSDAKKISDAVEEKESAQKRLSALEQAQKEIKGTGKTQKQIKDEKKKNNEASVKWKSTKNGNQTTYTAGGATITHRTGGLYHVQIGENRYTYTKLADAKAAAVLLRKRGK